MMLVNFLINVDNISYDNCIYLHPCPHDGDKISELPKEEYKKVMECRIKRHFECLNREAEE